MGTMQDIRLIALPKEALTQTALPGDNCDSRALLADKKRPLKLGPGLRYIPPHKISPFVAGEIVYDPSKPSIWMEYRGSHYVPNVSDLVIGQVLKSAADTYQVLLSPHSPPATLAHLSFEGATRKTRPQLVTGSLVYARVTAASPHMDPELECVSASTGKAEGLGPLLGGTVFDVPVHIARRMLMNKGRGGVEVLDTLGEEGLAFEAAVGRNGRVWVGSDSIGTVVVVGRALGSLEKGRDGGMMSVVEQRKLAKRLVREMK